MEDIFEEKHSELFDGYPYKIFIIRYFTLTNIACFRTWSMRLIMELYAIQTQPYQPLHQLHPLLQPHQLLVVVEEVVVNQQLVEVVNQ